MVKYQDMFKIVTQGRRLGTQSNVYPSMAVSKLNFIARWMYREPKQYLAKCLQAFH